MEAQSQYMKEISHQTSITTAILIGGINKETQHNMPYQNNSPMCSERCWPVPTFQPQLMTLQIPNTKGDDLGKSRKPENERPAHLAERLCGNFSLTEVAPNRYCYLMPRQVNDRGGSRIVVIEEGVLARFYLRGEVRYHETVPCEVFPRQILMEKCLRFEKKEKAILDLGLKPPEKVKPVKTYEDPSVECPISLCSEGPRDEYQHSNTENTKQTILPVEHIDESTQTRSENDSNGSGTFSIGAHFLTSNNPAPTTTSEKVFSCYICGKTYTQKPNLDVHIRRHTGETPFPCDLCPKRFASRRSLKIHNVSHTGERNFSCDECGNTFTQKSALNIHSRIHSDYKPFICNICGKRFTINTYLKSHILTHTGEKPYSCSVCCRAFTQKGVLNNHMRTHKTEKDFTCQECKKQFTTNGEFKVHMMRHAGQEFACELCDKSYTQKNNLSVHMRGHDANSQLSCHLCGKKFVRSNSFKLHMVVHTGEQPLLCECGRRFGDNVAYEKHQRTHSEDKPYGCNICGKRFSRTHQLENHMIVHSGLKPFPCHVCSRKFARSSDLKRHLPIHK
ncbi:unnamed protein product [Timema podura]|uniref:C2H2-type domain-containing protein n=2 Tax=Timema TaxID=61471 RepID=A0ABN7NBF6_TIMPD|nr:unnamed protein product [Timema podura]